MSSVGEIAQAVGRLLLLLTVIGSVRAAHRRREPHRLNILAVVGSLLFAEVFFGSRATAIGAVAVGALLAQPYFLLRLVDHFRRVPPMLSSTAAAIGIAGGLAYAFWPGARGMLLDAGLVGTSGALLVYPASAFTWESRRTSGVSAKRLVYAAAGTWCFTAFFGLLAAGPMLPITNALVLDVTRLLVASVLTCYYVAFATPRFLLTRWQRGEQARYLSDTNSHEPETRGARAAEDLLRAAERSVGHAAIVVATGAGQPADNLVVRAASGVPMEGATIVTRPEALLGRACRAREPLTGLPSDCEREVSDRFATAGSRVLVAPIVSSTHAWGAICVVQRRGSLFPEDDLQLLAAFGRYAATALDHAQLVADARDRERRAAARRLHEIESRMSLTFESIKDYAMVVLDRDGRVAAWHPGAENVFGFATAEVVNEPGAMLFDLAPGDFSELLDEAERRGLATREGLCSRKDGARFIGATVIRPLETETGDPPGYVAVTRDVTEQRDLEARLRQSQKMEAVGQLAGGIAHDFNNLLQAIRNYAELLSLPSAEGDPQELVSGILNSTDRAATLTRQLLAFTRRRMLQPVPIHLSRLVADLLPMLRRLIGEQIEFVDQTAPKLLAVMGDRGQVEQVIVNLAVNARDAMPSGGRLTIRTSDFWVDVAFAPGELAPGPHVLLEVIDTGVGMDTVTAGRIFEPFFTTKPFGSGTGLGLSTVYGIVKQMGGIVRVESAPRQGATFRVYVPATTQPVAAGVGVTTPEPPGGTETILLVEDDEVVRVSLVATLKRKGYHVLAAAHPTAALILAAAHPDRIDLLITDVVMPGRTGTELARELAETHPGVPTLYISGYADAVLSKEGTALKATHFLQKPFTAADLLTRIRQVLQ